MRVLFLEDRGDVAKHLKETLEERGHEVLRALEVSDAQSYWEDKQPIECLIVDLNMDPAGLPEGMEKETKGGLLTGWIWLRESVFKERPKMKPRTIIYTDYLGQLRELVTPEELEGIYLVQKRDLFGSSADKVLEYLEQIEKAKE